MQPLTSKKPKPLLEIGGITLLERAINLLTNHGVEEISINIHYLGHKLKNLSRILNQKLKLKYQVKKIYYLILVVG